MLGFPTIRIRPATTKDLDDDNVAILGQGQREALMQERNKQFHIKGVRRMKEAIKTIETKLAKIRQQQVTDQAELERLREKRARLFVEDSAKHVARIAKLDEQIEKLRTFINGLPDVITVLEKQLAEAKKKFAAEARNELLNKQKEVTEQAKELSEQLVEQLRVAVDTNQKLQVAYSKYQQLHNLTKVDLLGANFAEPSLGLLEYLYSFLKSELTEGKHCRMAMPGGLPPI